MASTEVNLSSLFATLNSCGQNGDYAKGVKIANKILKAAPGDTDAFHCKVVCQIQQSDFRQALRTINDNQKLSSNLVFEKAYCQYRLNQVEQALATIKAVPNPDIKLKELLGQVLYRLEKYQDCLDVYRDVIKNTSDDYEEERQTNLSAVIAAAQLWGDTTMEDQGLSEDTFELCYNKACLLVGQGQIKEAEKKLKEAERLCRESLEDDPDMTEEDIESEVAVIQVQLAYVLQLQGKNEEALKIYNNVFKSRPSDAGLLAVTCNNIITLNKEQNVFDSKKKIKTATADGLEHKLTEDQRRVIAFNKCLLLMYTNQGEALRKFVKTLQSDYPERDVPHLIETAQLCREKHATKAIQQLQKYVDEKADPSVRIKLTLAQLHLSQGNIGQAYEALHSIEELQHKPGMVSTLVCLCVSLENVDAAIEILDAAVQYYRENQISEKILHVLLKENADFKLKRGRSKEATDMLEDLRSANPDDTRTLAQLISAYAKFNPTKAEELSEELPSVAESSEDLDLDKLENTPFLFGSKYLKKVTKPDKPETTDKKPVDLIQKKKKKKRRGKLPKSYDPNSDPDPERWLPKRERTYYKGRKKDKKGGVGKGTQGASASAMSELDASKPSSTPSSPRAGSAQAPPGPSASQPGPRQKSAAARKKPKKKKGGNW
ncbi:signal recognition particle subunit SRP72-like [Ptychodera flava]|uniref:signal recognition particle subunit SRP72-like n=1 Tax=Ptychodera flava TaxID=63121 RepID=UPI00396A28B8